MKITLCLAFLAALIPAGLRAEPSVAKYKAELLAADAAFSARSLKEGILPAFLSMATPETKILSESGKGFDAVRAGFKDVQPGATLTWKPSQAEASLGGDLGYTWGRYEYADRTDASRPIVETGTYVTIWRRQADGSWKVVLDGGTPDPKTP